MNTAHLVEGPATAAALLRQIDGDGFSQDDHSLRLIGQLPIDATEADRFMKLREDWAIARSVFIVEAAALIKGR